jgi:hypothetical protein
MLEDFLAIIYYNYTDDQLGKLIAWADYYEAVYASFNSDYVCWRDRGPVVQIPTE